MSMGDMGLLEWALLFDKITLVEYVIINAAMVVIVLIALAIKYWRDKD